MGGYNVPPARPHAPIVEAFQYYQFLEIIPVFSGETRVFS
jgi:hypothetical protein